MAIGDRRHRDRQAVDDLPLVEEVGRRRQHLRGPLMCARHRRLMPELRYPRHCLRMRSTAQPISLPLPPPVRGSDRRAMNRLRGGVDAARGLGIRTAAGGCRRERRWSGGSGIRRPAGRRRGRSATAKSSTSPRPRRPCATSARRTIRPALARAAKGQRSARSPTSSPTRRATAATRRSRGCSRRSTCRRSRRRASPSSSPCWSG